MLVAVVGIRYMWMDMFFRLMPVPMAVGFGGCVGMVVIVVPVIVAMSVLVLKSFMRMFMSVRLG